MTLTYEINDTELQRALGAVVQATRNQATPLRQASIIALQSVQHNFRVGGRPAWRPLSPVTVKRRRRGSSLPLRDTGMHILDTITAESDAERAVIGPGPGPIPRVHQFGFAGTVRQSVRSHTRRITSGLGKSGRALKRRRVTGTTTVRAFSRTMRMNIPARPYLVIQKEDEEKIIEKFVDWNTGAWKLAMRLGTQ